MVTGNHGFSSILAPASVPKREHQTLASGVLPIGKPLAAKQDHGFSQTNPSKLFYQCSKYLELTSRPAGLLTDMSTLSSSVDDAAIDTTISLRDFKHHYSSMASDDEDTLSDPYRQDSENRSDRGNLVRTNTTNTANTSSTTTTKRDDQSIRERFDLQLLMDLQHIHCSRRPNPSFCVNQGRCMSLMTVSQLVNTRQEFLARMEESTTDRKEKYDKYLKQAFRDVEDNFHFDIRAPDLPPQANRKPNPPLRICEQAFLQCTGICQPFGLMKEPGRNRAPRSWLNARKEITDGVTPAEIALAEEIAALERETEGLFESSTNFILKVMERFSDESPLPGDNTNNFLCAFLLLTIVHS